MEFILKKIEIIKPESTKPTDLLNVGNEQIVSAYCVVHWETALNETDSVLSHLRSAWQEIRHLDQPDAMQT